MGRTSMIEVVNWTRKHRSELERWPIEPNRLLPALLLRSEVEPLDVEPSSFAIIYEGSLIGRFSYRLSTNAFAFVGLVISPAFRGRRLAAPALRGSLVRLGEMGVRTAYCSIAVANIPSMAVFSECGFYSMSLDWRALPAGFDVRSLVGFPIRTYRILPFPAMLYTRMFASLDALLYTEVAQQ